MLKQISGTIAAVESIYAGIITLHIPRNGTVMKVFPGEHVMFNAYGKMVDGSVSTVDTHNRKILIVRVVMSCEIDIESIEIRLRMEHARSKVKRGKR